MSTGNIIWVVGYPKSGTTWLRSLLTAYQSADATVDINALGTINAANRTLVDHTLGIETSDFGLDELRNLLPTAFSAWATEPDGPHFVKTHDAYVIVSGNQPLFPSQITRGVIHLVRDPRDVAVSSRHYWGVSQDEAIDAMTDPERWVLRGRPYSQLPIFLSDWSTHTESWLDSPLQCFVLRYEDLLANTASRFASALNFCGIDPDHFQIERAVNACSFSRLQSQERHKGYAGLPNVATAPFFRTGISGCWNKLLTEEQEAKIIQAHSVVMTRMGYLQ